MQRDATTNGIFEIAIRFLISLSMFALCCFHNDKCIDRTIQKHNKKKKTTIYYFSMNFAFLIIFMK